MAQGDAVRTVPTVADEMAKFKGFVTHNGETVDSVTDSDEEKAAQAASAAADATAAKAAKARPVKEFVAGEAPVVETPAAKPVVKPAAEPEGDEDPAADEGQTITMAEHKKLLARAAAKRIGEVKRAGREALTAEQQRNDTLERRLAALEGKGLTPGDKGATEANPDVEPKASDFEFGELDAKYVRALARFEARQEFKAGTKNQQQTEQTRAAERQAAEMVTQRAALEKEGAAKYADFDEVVTQSRQLDVDDPAFWPMSRELGSLVMGSEVRADLVYHLASNPDEARKIFGKTPLEQAAYFGRLEAKFSAESGANDPNKGKPADGQAQAVRVPKAPAPLQNRVRGSGGSNNQVSGATTDFAAFEAKARAEGTRRR